MTSRREKIRIKDISKVFTTRTGQIAALEEINLTIGEGEFVCIVGPSGCGKSTLLSIVAGLERPDSGIVEIAGEEKNRPDRVVIFQEGALFPWLTVYGNVEFGLKMAGLSRKERFERAMRYIEMVNLTRFADAYLHELSGGMRQRVAIARALVLEPSILLMDEPFAALDAQTRDLLHQEIQQIWLATQKTILFITHNVREAACLGDRVVVMTYRPGRIKKIFAMDHPRPRHIEDPILMISARGILDDLKDEVQKAMEEELAGRRAPTRE